MRKRIKLLYVAVIAFVIIAGGLIALNGLNSDIRVLEDTARETQLRLLEVNTAKSNMQEELAIKDTHQYIEEMARSKYGYLMPNEIRFVVVNPEVLYDDDYTPPQVEIVGSAGEAQP